MSQEADRLRRLRRVSVMGATWIALMLVLLALGSASGAAQTTCGGSAIAYGGALSGQISTAGATCRYTFTGKAGEVAAVRLARINSTRLDPTLTILTPSRVSKTDDNNGGGVDSAIVGYALPSAGAYTITAGAANRTTGSFRLALAKCGALPSSGRSTSASLTSGQIACYQFTGRQGQAVDLRMDEGKADSTFDPVLDLYTPDGKRRTTAAASGATSARLTDTLPTSGVYTVIARSNRDQGAGSYTLKRTK